MSAKGPGFKATTGPATTFTKGGKTFVTFKGPGCGTAEVFGPREFEAERGETFAAFCKRTAKGDHA